MQTFDKAGKAAKNNHPSLITTFVNYIHEKIVQNCFPELAQQKKQKLSNFERIYLRFVMCLIPATSTDVTSCCRRCTFWRSAPMTTPMRVALQHLVL
jgi:hypothetical protein